MPEHLGNSDTTPTVMSEDNLFARTLKRWFLRRSLVSAIQTLSPNFLLIELQGDALKAAMWVPGQHIQVDIGAGLTFRTYTPMSWNNAGCTRLLVFLHGDGPRCTWARSVSVGDPCAFFGPHRSLDLTRLKSSIALFGDETCFGLALAIRDGLPEIDLKCVFEVSYLAESQRVLNALKLNGAILIRRVPDGSHLVHAGAEMSRLADAGYQNALTGNARSIQRLSKVLKAIPVGASRLSVKPYWAPGKTGLN